jgi:hypothetical protein
MNRTLSVILANAMGVAIVATYLLAQGLASANHDAVSEKRDVRMADSASASEGAAAGSEALCRGHVTSRYADASQRDSKGSVATTSTTDGNPLELAPAQTYVYVTVIQSDGIPVVGVYSAQKSRSNAAMFRMPRLLDVFSIC